MILYRYLKDFYIDALKDESFKVSRPSDFDDKTDCEIVLDGLLPEDFRYEVLKLGGLRFESAPCKEGIGARKKATNALSESINQLLENIKILCFCDVDKSAERDAYMWKRYGGGFTGVRFGFSIQDDLVDKELSSDNIWIKRVRYCKSLSAKHIQARHIHHQNSFVNEVKSRMFIKLKKDVDKPDENYEMENEVRCVFHIDRSELKQLGGLYFTPFSILDGMKLTSVDIGGKMPETNKEAVRQIVASKWPNLKVTIVGAKELD